MNGARVCLSLIIISTALVSRGQAHFLRQVFGHTDGPLVDDDLHYAKPGISVAELLMARGYKAQEFKFTSRDGYIISITRGTNPLINGGERGLDHKLPIVFLHGSTIPSTTYVLNSVGIRPKVYDSKGIDWSQMTTNKLSKMLKGDPSVKSIAFLAMNFGYEVWILDRRGFQGSRGKTGYENRTMTDAFASMPMSLLGNILDGFSMTAGMEPHRQLRGDELPLGTKADDRQKRHFLGSSHRAANTTGDTSGGREQSSEAHKQPKRINFLQALIAVAKLNQSQMQPMKSITDKFVDTFDADYWRFSLDEQAEFDLPAAIDFVLEKTGKKQVHTIGMSCGGALILLALADQPKLAEKISKAVLWAPSVNMGSRSDIVYLLSHAIPFFQTYSGPIPFIFLLPTLERYLTILCSSEFMQRTICEAALGAIMGFSGGQAPLRLYMAGNLVRPTGVNELIHLGQMSRTETPCKFQLHTREANIKKYGQEKAPCYDLGQITLRNMSFYVGATDALVSIDDIKTTARQMKVPVELNFINKRGIYFNHMGFFLHKKLDKLAVLPTLIDFERSELHRAGHDDTSNWKIPDLQAEGHKVLDSFTGGANEIDQPL